MAKYTVYRVENERGGGPYVEGNLEFLYKHDNSVPTHPSPFYDFGPFGPGVPNQGDWQCGFSSLEQAEAWFTKRDFTMMAKHGYTLKRFDGIKDDDVVTGGHQVLFRRDKYKPAKGFNYGDRTETKRQKSLSRAGSGAAVMAI